MSVDLSKSTNSSSVAESELLDNGGAPAEATAKNRSSKEIDAKERHLSTDHLASFVIALPVLNHFAGRQGPVTRADLWFGIFRYLPLWAFVCGTTYSMCLLVAGSAPLVQLVVCAPVGLIAGLILIWVLTSMRRTALGLVDILRELKSRRVSSDTR